MACGLAALVAAFLLCQGRSTLAAEPVSLELLLAVDVSGSVDAREFRLQIQGIAQAFSDPHVLQVIRSLGEQGIAVALVQWSGASQQTLSIGWTLVHDEASATELAARIAGTSRLYDDGDTLIGAAVNFSVRQFDGNGYEGSRRVIDISGDGGGGHRHATSTMMATHARDNAVARAVTINGLTIVNDVPDLDRFFRDHVIGGTGAFVVIAHDYADFAAAMIDKLVKEIGGPPVARLGPHRAWTTAMRAD